MKAAKEPVIVAAVEGGGTSFVVAVSEVDPERSTSTIKPPKILYRSEIDSSHENPQVTLNECAAFFEKHKPDGGYHALGLATFGPVGLDKTKKTYGHILSTSPKKFWRNVDLISPLVDACRGTRPLSVEVETDVNAPALAEYLNCKDSLSSVAYVTVGTGIGVGLVIHGQPVHGRMHPEGGHCPVQPLDGDSFPGYSWGEKCPFRGRHTVEGLASSVALTERLQQLTEENNLSRSLLSELDDNHEIWDHAANAISNLCVTLLLVTSVEKIIIGGGIMKRRGLIEKIRERTVVLVNEYLELPSDMSQLITTSSYGEDVGLTGALLLAQRAYQISLENKESEKSDSSSSDFTAGVVHGIVLGIAATVGLFFASRRHQSK